MTRVKDRNGNITDGFSSRARAEMRVKVMKDEKARGVPTKELTCKSKESAEKQDPIGAGT